MIQKEKKQAVMAEYRTHESDTGSPEVQVAVLTERVRELTEHLKIHKKDFHEADYYLPGDFELHGALDGVYFCEVSAAVAA